MYGYSVRECEFETQQWNIAFGEDKRRPNKFLHPEERSHIILSYVACDEYSSKSSLEKGFKVANKLVNK